jgi:hypothetical protein
VTDGRKILLNIGHNGRPLARSRRHHWSTHQLEEDGITAGPRAVVHAQGDLNVHGGRAIAGAGAL